MGNAMLSRTVRNVVIFGECMLELSDAGHGLYKRQFAGDTFNTAVYLKRCLQSVNVSYFTAIGYDSLSEAFETTLLGEGIDSSLLLRTDDHHLGCYLVNTDPEGERTFLYWRDNSAARQTFNLYQGTLPQTDLFYFSGISLAILDDSQRHRLFELVGKLKEAGCLIAFDTNYRASLWSSKGAAMEWINKAYSCSDIAFVGGDDHRSLFGHTDSASIFAHLLPYKIQEIVNKFDFKAQIGGGVRTIESVKQYIDAGVEKVILGSGAIKNKDFLKEACNKFKNKIALGLDAKDGKLFVSGWKENLNVKTIDYLKEVNSFGVSRIIYTDINRDGMKTSPNFEETVKIAEISNCPVVISGGVSSINDIKKAKELNNKKIEGIIVGKAIYDGDIKLDELAKEIDA